MGLGRGDGLKGSSNNYETQVFSPSVNRYLVPAIAISYCIVGHLHRQYINYMGWDLDFTGPQMVVTIKLYSLAWNLYDGKK